MRTQIKVFVTKNRKLRVSIQEVNQNEDGYLPKYEVTIGGKEWKKGKGCLYKFIILTKCRGLLNRIEQEYNTFLNEYADDMEPLISKKQSS